MEQAIEGAEQVHRVKAKPGPKPKIAAVVQDSNVRVDLVAWMESPEGKAQAYAMRVWDGQSVDVPPAERKERVFNALRGQNLPTDGIVFPA